MEIMTHLVQKEIIFQTNDRKRKIIELQKLSVYDVFIRIYTETGNVCMSLVRSFSLSKHKTSVEISQPMY